jgi:hypothetical protein
MNGSSFGRAKAGGYSSGRAHRGLPAQPRTARAATYTWSVNTPIVAMLRCVPMLAFTRPPGRERYADELSRRFQFCVSPHFNLSQFACLSLYHEMQTPSHLD